MMVQGSPEWFAAKLGKASASRLSDIMATTKSGYSTSRDNYMAELACERLTGVNAEHYTSKAMDDGKKWEPMARSAYEAKTGEMVEEVGFIDHPTIKNFGASPDGLVGLDGGLEIKSPFQATHIKTLFGKTVDRGYVLQMYGGLCCTGREWWDFVSYNPKFPENLSYKCIRFYRDTEMVQSIENEVIRFLAELDEMVERLKAL